MFMDPVLQEFAMNGFKYDNFYPDGNAMDGFRLQQPQSFLNPNEFMHNPYIPSAPAPQNGNPAPSLSVSAEGESLEDSEIFSDVNLNYISQILLEEDIDEKVNMCHEQSALQAAEKPFYDILNEKYLPSPDQPPLDSNNSLDSPDDSHYGHAANGSNNRGATDNSWSYDPIEYHRPQVFPVSADYSSLPSFNASNVLGDHPSKSSSGSSTFTVDSSSHYSFSSSKSVGKVIKAAEDQLSSMVRVPSLFLDSQSAWQFRRGVEEAQKFLPSQGKLVIDSEASWLSFPQARKEESRFSEVKLEEGRDYSVNVSRGRKNRNSEDLDLAEGRSIKQSAVSFEDTVRSEMFDRVLLCNGGQYRNDVVLREAEQNETSKNSQYSHSKGSNGGRSRGKKQVKKEVVDLRTLLVHCAQAVAADDHRSANELLKQIRQHASPFGDGSQRLAHCFADGLEARLAGTGSQIYHSLMAKRPTATDILKAYRLYLAACPFKKISHFFANRTILNAAEKASRLHVIDFGIYFGFQWPILIQRLSSRPGGPPKLRITGIDVPQPGFRPTERIEETGRRLADYAESFKVPFEYHSIASKWENIRVEDLKIDEDEVLIVNCLYRFRNLVDETVVVDSPRNKVLNTIRKMNPDVFIHGIMNGSYSVPFFVTRFREALFHFSALFDMLETIVPREDAQRLLIERDLFGREAMNVIACEGSERVERPETYKQWQIRNLRAGFTQLPLNLEIMKRARDRVKTSYHKDFVIDEDSRWLLQGWKGRIIYAVSSWRPT